MKTFYLIPHQLLHPSLSFLLGKSILFKNHFWFILKASSKLEDEKSVVSAVCLDHVYMIPEHSVTVKGQILCQKECGPLKYMELHLFLMLYDH